MRSLKFAGVGLKNPKVAFMIQIGIERHQRTAWMQVSSFRVASVSEHELMIRRTTDSSSVVQFNFNQFGQPSRQPRRCFSTANPSVACARIDKEFPISSSQVVQTMRAAVGQYHFGVTGETSDVDPYRSGNDCTFGRNDAANGRANSGVNVGHRGDVTVNDGQARDILELTASCRLEVGRPHLDGDAAILQFNCDWHGGRGYSANEGRTTETGVQVPMAGA